MVAERGLDDLSELSLELREGGRFELGDHLPLFEEAQVPAALLAGAVGVLLRDLGEVGASGDLLAQGGERRLPLRLLLGGIVGGDGQEDMARPDPLGEVEAGDVGLVELLDLLRGRLRPLRQLPVEELLDHEVLRDVAPELRLADAHRGELLLHLLGIGEHLHDLLHLFLDRLRVRNDPLPLRLLDEKPLVDEVFEGLSPERGLDRGALFVGDARPHLFREGVGDAVDLRARDRRAVDDRGRASRVRLGGLPHAAPPARERRRAGARHRAHQVPLHRRRPFPGAAWRPRCSMLNAP